MSTPVGETPYERVTMIENRNPRCDLFAVILAILALFLTVSLLTYNAADPVGKLVSPLDKIYQADVLVWPQNNEIKNACGHWGAITADLLFTTMGIGAFFLIIGIGAVAIALLQRQSIESLWSRTLGWLLTLVGMTTLATMLLPHATLGPVIGPGGYIGVLGAGLLKMSFAGVGGMILATSVLAIGLFLWTDYIFIKVIGFALVSVLTVFQFILPTGAIAWVRDRFQLEDDEEYEYEYEEEEEDDDEEEEVGRRKSMFADAEEEDDGEYEEEQEEEEEDEEAWYEEELDDQPETSPFAVKTAAKTTALVEPEEAEDEEEVVEEPVEPTKSKRGSLFGIGRKKKSAEEEARQEVITRLNAASLTEDSQDYDLPDIGLLEKSKTVPKEDVMKLVGKTGRLLEQKFAEFGQNIRVVDVETGPVITQYELDLEKGLRVNKLISLADDIAVRLRVPSVRVVPSIPGKNTVGIEVPNEKRQFVRLRDVMETSSAKARKMKVPLFLGQDVAGNHMVADLSQLPHLLIAGRTGTGKSVCLNAIINSILMTRRPDEVRLLMIDPKMVEMSGYSRIPHLMHPVVTDMRKAEAILAWAVQKMEDRYRLMARAGVRHINSYNQLGEEELMERLDPDDEERDEIPVNMPFIVIIADEIADLMMSVGKEVESHIIRLAQKSRAVGIHLILATQKPLATVVTSLIKSNLPARISFQVSSQNDSRVVLDENGAEKLLGNGDMLYLAPGTSKLMRGQGTFVSDEEIDSIVESVSTGEQNFVNELVNLKIKEEGEEGAGVDDDELNAKLAKRDDLYHRAVEIVINEQRGSCSLLQRALRIGYGRAARVIDHMEEDGVVGPYNGSKHREVVMTMQQWQNFQNENQKDGAGSPPKASSAAPKPAPKPIKPKSKTVKITNNASAPIEVAQSIVAPLLKKPVVVEEDELEDEEEYEDDEIVDEAEDWEYEEDEDEDEEGDDEYEYEDDEEDEDESAEASAEADDEWEYEEVDEEDSDEDDEYEYVYEELDEEVDEE